MTTAHKPTFHPAVGSAHQGGFRHYAGLKQYSSRDLAAHTTMKYRQTGQNTLSEVQTRDLKKELQQREAKHFQELSIEKKKQGLLAYSTEDDTKTPAIAKEILAKAKHDAADADADADAGDTATSGGQGDEDVDVVGSSKPKVDLSQFDDSDDEEVEKDAESDKDGEDDEEDDEAELMRELERIKKEREEEQQRRLREEEERKAKERTDAVLRGNPLLNLAPDASFKVKRRWDEDVVFKNQARDEPTRKKRFINDTIRSDFHKNFLRRYIQ